MLRRIVNQANRLIGVIWKLFPASHYVLLSALLVVGLELIFILQQWVTLVTVVTITVVILGVVLVRLEERGRFGLIHAVLPILATAGSAGYAFLLPTTSVLHLYILAAGLIFFFLLKHGAREAYPIWNWTLSLVVYFLNIAFILGLRSHLYIPVLLVLVLVLAVTVLMGLQALRRVVRVTSEIVLPALTMAFVLTEVVWVLQFLPSHYLVQTGVVTILYYVIFSLISLSYTRALVRRDIVEYVVVGGVASLIILISTRWT